MTPTVLYEPEPPIAYLTLNRPDRLNALSTEVRDDLNEVLDLFAADGNVRVGILRGAGRAFCAGFDLSVGSPSAEKPSSIWDDRQRMRSWIDTFLRIHDSEKPVIAQIHGYCLAGGMVIPPCCDITIIAEDCTVGMTKLPLGGGYVGPIIAMLIGGDRAKLMEFDTGREIDGKMAVKWGFATQAVAAEDVAATTRSLALRIARIPSDLLALKKFSINRAMDRVGFRATYESVLEWDALAHADAGTEKFRASIRELGMKEAIRAFEMEGPEREN
jgi:enoyl-CoA hydratase